MDANATAVAAVLGKYQDALNQSDTDAVMKLHASDGMRPTTTRASIAD